MTSVPASNTTTWTTANYLWQASAILDESLHQLGGANLPWNARIGYTTPWTYSFGLLFLKRLSDRFEEKAEALMAEGVSERVAMDEPGRAPRCSSRTRRAGAPSRNRLRTSEKR